MGPQSHGVRRWTRAPSLFASARRAVAGLAVLGALAVVSALATATPTFAQSAAPPAAPTVPELSVPQRLKGTAAARGLAATREWRKLLFYVPRLFHDDTSTIDDPKFFYAKHGDSDAAAELDATIDAMLAPVDPAAPDAHALCRFPVRFAYLAAALPEIAALAPPPCRERDRFFAAHPVSGVTLIFASYFANNPASMFGHTFLRLTRAPGLLSGNPALLDFAVNFAANPTTRNPLAYAWLGMVGGFPGTFSMMPYYLKIQEYNNSESRDLWEYPLNVTSAEAQRLLAVLWEVGPNYINYYYLDENCSFVMMQLLEAMRPSLVLAEQFHPQVIPADTVRAVVSIPGLAGPAVYRASERTRFSVAHATLSMPERDAFEGVTKLRPGASTALEKLPLDGQRRVLDAALEWVDFDEALAGSMQSARHAQLQSDLLARRAKLGPATPPQIPRPELERPEEGPRSTLVAVAGGRDQRGRGIGLFTWRPALHSYTEPARGYSSELSVEILTTALRFTPELKRVALEDFHLFDAISAPGSRLGSTPLAWRISIGATRDAYGALISYAEGGAGLSAGLGPVRAFALGLGRIGGRYGDGPTGAYVGPAALGAIVVPLGSDVSVSATYRAQRSLLRDGVVIEHRLRGQISWAPTRDIDVVGSVEHHPLGTEATLGAGVRY